ncbi:MAG: protein-L-isoaspartate(D-aspartate) O-methyltransferase [Acidobacteria bacterium]|nr:MAG: protein-L-isoaspartate(D-aspartate) O-methyltransferase [Acidobacteriota bacterium]
MRTNGAKAKSLNDPFAEARRRMIAVLRRKGITDERVLAAMAKIPRHVFVEEKFRSQAYEDRPLPIGCGQTISQPFMVALMTQLLDLRPEDRVLEIGGGSGYHTAILASLARQVVSIERIPELAEKAAARLAQLGLDNVIVTVGDGTTGWSPLAPYDAILVAAGSPDIPQPLIDQLHIGGRLVIPVGEERLQRLIRVIKGERENRIEDHGGCVFVKLLGQHGWEE